MCLCFVDAVVYGRWFLFFFFFFFIFFFFFFFFLLLRRTLRHRRRAALNLTDQNFRINGGCKPPADQKVDDSHRQPIRFNVGFTSPPQPNDIQTFQKWIESDQSVSQLVWWTERWWQCESSRSDGWPRRGWWQLTEDGCIDPNGIIGGGAPRCGGAILLAAPLPSSAFSSSRRFKQAAFGFRFRSATHTPENDIRKTENSAADSSAAVSRPFISDRVDRQCNRSSWTTTNESAELNGRLKAAAARYHRYEIC